MSHENVELIQNIADAVARRDLQRMLELTDPDIHWHPFFAQLIEGGVYRGHDGVRQYMADLAETAEILRADIDDVLTVGATALAIGRLTYRGKGSGAQTERAVGYFIKVRNGRVLQLRVFDNPEQAIGVLGPSE